MIKDLDQWDLDQWELIEEMVWIYVNTLNTKS